MKVFISYSSTETKFVKDLAAHLATHVDPIFWGKDKLPGDEDWPSIFKWIEQSKFVVVVLSDAVLRRGIAVGQEIGFAKKCGKTIIPFVSETVEIKDIGFLKGITPVRYNEGDPSLAVAELIEVIKSKKEKISEDEGIMILGV